MGASLPNFAFREMCEQLNVQVATTAAESPLSNGIVESNNLVIYEAIGNDFLSNNLEMTYNVFE